MIEAVPKRTRWAGKGSGAGHGKGHSRPGRATQGTPVCTCPGPPARAPPGRGELAPALQAPGSGVRFFVPAHARPILTDGVRGSPAANRRARLASSAPSDSGVPPLRRPTWSGPAPLSLLFGCSTLGGFLCSCWSAQSACLRAPGRSLSPAPRLLLGPREPKTRGRCCPPFQQGRARASIRQGNGRAFRARRSHRNPVRYRRYHNPDCFREGEGRKGAGKFLVPKSV